MRCSHCNKEFEEKDIQEHHIHPKFMDNKKGSGMKINLCKDCHMRLHLNIPSIYWDILTEEQKKTAIEAAISMGKWWGKIK